MPDTWQIPIEAGSFTIILHQILQRRLINKWSTLSEKNITYFAHSALPSINEVFFFYHRNGPANNAWPSSCHRYPGHEVVNKWQQYDCAFSNASPLAQDTLDTDKLASNMLNTECGRNKQMLGYINGEKYRLLLPRESNPRHQSLWYETNILHPRSAWWNLRSLIWRKK